MKLMLDPKRWIAKLANLYDSDGRRNVRIPANFHATISGPFGNWEVAGIDANRDGAGVQASDPLPKGTLVFLRIGELGLMGFAHVRHCSQRGDGYRLGLQFRERLTRERGDDQDWVRQRLAHSEYRMWDEPDA
jgi:hypothetical protein